MKRIFIVLVFIFLNGCMAIAETKLQIPYEVSSKSINVVDNRPENQKLQKVMSLSLSNCLYGSYQMGEEKESPNRVVVLENYLSHHLGLDFNGETFLLKNFTIHANLADKLRKGVSNMYGGGLLADNLIKEETVGCSNDDLLGGYSKKEVGNGETPLIVVIDLEVNGITYHSRVVKVLENTWLKPSKKWDMEVQGIIIEALSQLVGLIEKERSISQYKN